MEGPIQFRWSWGLSKDSFQRSPVLLLVLNQVDHFPVRRDPGRITQGPRGLLTRPNELASDVARSLEPPSARLATTGRDARIRMSVIVLARHLSPLNSSHSVAFQI